MLLTHPLYLRHNCMALAEHFFCSSFGNDDLSRTRQTPSLSCLSSFPDIAEAITDCLCRRLFHAVAFERGRLEIFVEEIHKLAQEAGRMIRRGEADEDYERGAELIKRGGSWT